MSLSHSKWARKSMSDGNSRRSRGIFSLQSLSMVSLDHYTGRVSELLGFTWLVLDLFDETFSNNRLIIRRFKGEFSVTSSYPPGNNQPVLHAWLLESIKIERQSLFLLQSRRRRREYGRESLFEIIAYLSKAHFVSLSIRMNVCLCVCVCVILYMIK